MSWILRVAAFAAILAPICASAGPLADQVTADPFTPQWLFRPNGTPIFMCGPGDPEGFLYRGTRNSDGTRSGDQMSLIGTMAGTGANCLYLIAVRSHGGDGDATENPFVNSDPAQGLDQDILDQWDTWFTAMDDAGIIIYFFFYDDSATIWNTGDSVGNEERTFVQTLVNRFEGHANLIWCVAEEYSEAFSIPRISNLAAEIRAADDYDHVIAVHQRSGTDFDFPSDPNIDQFAIQFNVATAGALHTGMLWAWDSANGQYQLNMSEAAAYGTGATARQKSWGRRHGRGVRDDPGDGRRDHRDLRSRGLWAARLVHGVHELPRDGSTRRAGRPGHEVRAGGPRQVLHRLLAGSRHPHGG